MFRVGVAASSILSMYKSSFRVPRLLVSIVCFCRAGIGRTAGTIGNRVWVIKHDRVQRRVPSDKPAVELPIDAFKKACFVLPRTLNLIAKFEYNGLLCQCRQQILLLLMLQCEIQYTLSAISSLAKKFGVTPSSLATLFCVEVLRARVACMR